MNVLQDHAALFMAIAVPPRITAADLSVNTDTVTPAIHCESLHLVISYDGACRGSDNRAIPVLARADLTRPGKDEYWSETSLTVMQRHFD